MNLTLTARQIIDEFHRNDWASKPMEKTKALIKAKNFKELKELIKIALDEIDNEQTFIDASLSFLSQEDFQEIILIAVDKFQKSQNSNVEAIIAYASVQFPKLLEPYFDIFISKRPNESLYHEKWIWRKANEKYLEKIVQKIQNAEPNHLEDLWGILLNIRLMKSVEKAQALLKHMPEKIQQNFKRDLLEIGFEIVNGKTNQLFRNRCHHIIFEKSYVENEFDIELHPTWDNKNIIKEDVDFGGTVEKNCCYCDEKLHKIIDIPKGIIDFRNEQTLVTCIYCLEMEVPILYFQHNGKNQVQSIKTESLEKKRIGSHQPILTTKAKIGQTIERWEFQDWALSNNRENLNRIGGFPSWIQSAEKINCPKCEETMNFICQIDSFLPTEDGELLWGGGGICYFHWCYNCSTSGMFLQC